MKLVCSIFNPGGETIRPAFFVSKSFPKKMQAPKQSNDVQPTPDNSNLQEKSKKVRLLVSSKKTSREKGKKTVFTAQ